MRKRIAVLPSTSSPVGSEDGGDAPGEDGWGKATPVLRTTLQLQPQHAAGRRGSPLARRRRGAGGRAGGGGGGGGGGGRWGRAAAKGGKNLGWAELAGWRGPSQPRPGCPRCRRHPLPPHAPSGPGATAPAASHPQLSLARGWLSSETCRAAGRLTPVPYGPPPPLSLPAPGPPPLPPPQGGLEAAAGAAEPMAGSPATPRCPCAPPRPARRGAAAPAGAPQRGR